MAANRAAPTESTEWSALPAWPAQTALTKPEKIKIVLKAKSLADAPEEETVQESTTPSSSAVSDDAEIYSPNALPLSLKRRAMVASRQGMVGRDKTKSNGRAKRRTKVKLNHRRIVESESSDAAPEHSADEQDGRDQPASTPPNLKPPSPLTHIATSLTTFPTGEVACGRGLQSMPMPEIELLNHGVITEPYHNQLSAIKDFARELRAKRYGIDWKAIKKTPTWTIPGSVVEVKHRFWEDVLAEYAREAGQYLGFGKQKLTTRLQNLHLWEKGSMWRDYHNEHYDPTRVGNLLIILNRSYKGGEIAVGCGDKEMFYDPASSKQRHFIIASHNKAKHDTLPLTSGHRLGLAYDLRLDAHDGRPLVYDILERVADAENDLFYQVACWAEEVELGRRANHPLLFVLGTNYEHPDMHMDYLTAEDRARALAVGNVAREVYGEREKSRLRGYLVSVTGTTKISRKKGKGGEEVGRRVRYAIHYAKSLEGVVMSEMEEMFVDKRGVLQPGEFESGISRKIDGKTVESIRSRTCLMLVLEKEGDEEEGEKEDTEEM